MKYHLIYYNSVTVGLAIEAVSKCMGLLGIDPLKELLKFWSGIPISVCQKAHSVNSHYNEDPLFQRIKSLFCGPSIVFSRHAKANKTSTEQQKQSNPRKVKAIPEFMQIVYATYPSYGIFPDFHTTRFFRA